MRLWLRRLAPFVITGAVVAVVLYKYPLSKIVAEMANGNTLPLIPIALVMTVGLLLLVSAWDHLVIYGFLGRPRYRDVLRGKAGTSMLLTIGYAFGHGGYAVWIARATGASLGETAGVTLYISASDLCALSTISSLVILLGDADVPRALAIAAPCISGVMLLVAVIGPFKWLVGDLPKVFQPWQRLSRRRQLLNIAGRCANISLGIVFTWLAIRAFGLNIPLTVVASYLPLIILVGALPVNVGGFGPVQAVWLVFEPWASGPAILAFNFLWHLIVAGGLVLRGLPFIRRTIREIEEGRATFDASDAD